ncbi:MAG: hypothetical protein WC091_20485, partial [Sulfuricellaceae bacterium]
QIRLDGPYFTDFLVNRMAIDQKIGEICPRPAEFSLRFFKSGRLLEAHAAQFAPWHCNPQKTIQFGQFPPRKA